MKTAEEVRKEIIGIVHHSPEGEPFIIDEILESYAREVAENQKQKMIESAIDSGICCIDSTNCLQCTEFKHTPLVTNKPQ